MKWKSFPDFVDRFIIGGPVPPVNPSASMAPAVPAVDTPTGKSDTSGELAGTLRGIFGGLLVASRAERLRVAA